MTIIATGIGLAKNVFALHGVNAAGEVKLRQPKVTRGKLQEDLPGYANVVIGNFLSEVHHLDELLFPSEGD